MRDRWSSWQLDGYAHSPWGSHQRSRGRFRGSGRHRGRGVANHWQARGLSSRGRRRGSQAWRHEKNRQTGGLGRGHSRFLRRSGHQMGRSGWHRDCRQRQLNDTRSRRYLGGDASAHCGGRRRWCRWRRWRSHCLASRSLDLGNGASQRAGIRKDRQRGPYRGSGRRRSRSNWSWDRRRGNRGNFHGRSLLTGRTEMPSHLVGDIIFEGTRVGPLVGYTHLLQILDDRLALDFEFPC